MPQIYLDYGHGGNDSGAIGGGIKESVINIDIGKKVKYHLERHNMKVIESRTGDTNPSLSERSNKANACKVDLVLSIHCNSFSEPSAFGFETYHWEGSKRGESFARNLHYEFKKAKLIGIDRGMKISSRKANNFHIIRETLAPCVLVELGFISNYDDREILLTKQEEIAIAITKAILHYWEMVYHNENPKTPEIKTLYRVQVGAYQKLENANQIAEELKSKGYQAIVVKVE